MNKWYFCYDCNQWIHRSKLGYHNSDHSIKAMNIGPETDDCHTYTGEDPSPKNLEKRIDYIEDKLYQHLKGDKK